MNFLSQKILGIDMNDHSVAVVELGQNGKKIGLESYTRTLIPDGIIKNGEIKKEEELKTIITNLLQNANPKPIQTKNTAIVFPASKVLTHIFKFPENLTESDIRKSIPYEAETIIPFSINDVYWDFIILENEDEKQKHASQYVFFACIIKQVADEYENVLESIGLIPMVFGVNAETIKYALLGYLVEGQTSLVIDVESLSVNYLIIKDKTIKYYFSTNDGGKKVLTELAKELQITEKIILETKEKDKMESIKNSAKMKDFIEENYKRGLKIIQEQVENKTIDNVDNILLTGEFLNLPDFYETAKAQLLNKNVIIGDPKNTLCINEAKFIPPSTDAESPAPYSIYFTNAIGVGVRGIIGNSHNGMNLIPDRLKESFSNKKNALFVAIASIAMAAISLFLATFVFFKYQTLTYERLNLESKKSSVQKMLYGTRYQEIRDEINKFNGEVDAISGIDQGLFSLPTILSQIDELIPEGIEVSAIEFADEGLTVSINGIASDRDKLLEIQKNLGNVEFIEEVIAPISNYDEKSKISFLIKIKLNPIKLPKYGSSSNTK